MLNPRKQKEIEVTPEELKESEGWIVADLEYEYQMELKAEDEKKYWKQWH